MGTFFVVRDRVVLVVSFEGPALVTRVVARVDALGGGLAGAGLVEGGFLGGDFATTASSTCAGRTLGGLPRRLGAALGSASVVASTSITAAVVFLIVRFGGAFSVLEGPATALDRVALTAGCFFLGSGGSTFSDACSAFAARRVVRAVVRDLGGGFAGVTGPADRSLRREGSDGRGSAGAFRLGAIVGRFGAVR